MSQNGRDGRLAASACNSEQLSRRKERGEGRGTVHHGYAKLLGPDEIGVARLDCSGYNHAVKAWNDKRTIVGRKRNALRGESGERTGPRSRRGERAVGSGHFPSSVDVALGEGAHAHASNAHKMDFARH
jgi:hypothetical protein